VSQADLLEAVAAILLGQGPTAAAGGVITAHSMAESREPLHILLAEDNPVNQEVAATMLRKRGHKVELAGDGREAVAAVRTRSFDVVLMDIQMPDLDGYAATAQIRALPGRGDVPIIALTAHAYGTEYEHCIAAGMNGFVTKPFKAKELFAAVEGARAQRTPKRPIGPAPAEEKPVEHFVDLEGFRDQLRRSGVEEAIDGILETFLESTPSRVQTLIATLAAGSPLEVSRAAHAVKSSAGAIGARPLAALLAEIEKEGEEGTLVDRDGLSRRVREGFSAALKEVREYHTAGV
jgi:CheY-like chemotaxis protein